MANFSWGCTAENAQSCYRYPDGYAAQYDDLVYSKHASLVASAGNGESNYEILGFHTAYNLITVGNYDDWNNGDPSDNVMAWDSSYVDPISYHNDREKPDVVAPGQFVTTTGYTNTLMEVRGTSIAAP